jgi:small-conductance mechanosensitive channel
VEQSEGGKAVNPQYEAHERMCKSIGDMAKENKQLKERINRLEEAGDALLRDNDDMANINQWLKAKDAKL